jgi:prophage regulatory protein
MCYTFGVKKARHTCRQTGYYDVGSCLNSTPGLEGGSRHKPNAQSTRRVDLEVATLDTLSKQRTAAPKRLISLSEVLHRTAMRRAWLYRQLALGQFPPPVKIGRASRWVEAEVDHWIQAAADARDAVSLDTAA